MPGAIPGLATAAGGGLGALAGVSSVLGPAGALLGVGAGVFQMLSSMKKEKENKAALAALKTPFYKIQDEYYENKNLAAGAVANPISPAIQDAYTSESQRGLSAGIGGTLQAGGSPNDIAKLFDIYDRGIDKTHAQAAEQQVKNLQYYKESNKDLAGQKTTQWALNEYQPYQNKLKQLTQNAATNEQNAYSGFNTAVGGLGALKTGLDANAMNKMLFGKKPPTQEVAGAVEDPYQITAEPLQNLAGMQMPVDVPAAGLSTDEVALENYFNDIMNK